MRSTRSKILLVEDDAATCKLVRLALGSEGFAVILAADGVSAIAAAQRERPDLILLDIGLPGGDGLLVMERVKAIPRLAAIPVIVITGRYGEDMRARAFELGADGFLLKPIDMAALASTVREAIHP